MTSVDSRVVSMKFDNKQFQAGVAATMAALNKLRDSLSFTGASKGLEDINKEASKFNLNGMEKAPEKVSKAFLAMAAVAITAIANITNRAIDAGIRIAKSFTLDPVIQGFQEYELKLGSIQTIMAGSGASLEVVNEKLQELNTYADKTIYSFADMTTNIGKFTNAGVDLDTSVASIQGIANVAAVSGANANEASRAMYNFAQALSKGYVQLIDWKSIELANMGTVEFKQQLIDAAAAAGTLTKTADGWLTTEGKLVTATQGFNDSLTDQWLTTEVLNKTLGDYADETTDIGKKAFAAAQDVKTFTQLIDTVKEAIGSGWASSFEIIIGNFDEAKALFTNINNVISDMVDDSADARNKLLQDWKDAGGRDALLEGLANAWKAFKRVIDEVGFAFRDIFPPKTGKELADFTKRFRDFTQSLIPGEKTLNNLRSIMKGLFSIVKIGIEVVKGIWKVFSTLFGTLFEGTKGFSDLAASAGDSLTAFAENLSIGGAIAKFFQKIADGTQSAVRGFHNFIDAMREVFGGIAEFVGGAFGNITDILSNVFGNINWDLIVRGVGAGGIAALGGAFSKIAKNGLGFNFDFGGGMLDGLKDTLGGLTGVLEGMQANLKANALLKIAGAIGILALSLLLLASIDAEALKRAIGAMAGAMAGLLTVMQVMEKMAATEGFKNPIGLSGSMLLIAGAVLILSFAIKKLGELSWEEIGKGLIGVTGAMAILVGATKLMSSNAKGMFTTGLALIAVAIGIRIMASAIEKIGGMDLATIGKGLLGIAGALIVVAAGMRAMPKMITAAANMLILSVALNAMAMAVERFSKLDLKETGKGLLAMAGTLLIIAAAMHLMPSNMLLTAAALVGVSVALNLIAVALNSMGGMSWEEIARGLVAMGGSLGILALGLYLMSGALPGAAALIIAATAFMFLTPTLIALSALSWGEIVKGLVALAGAITVIGVAAAVFGLAAPLLLLGGAALVVFGAGLAMAGIGALAFATAFSVVMKAAAGGAKALTDMLGAIIDSIPAAMRAFGEGIVEFIKVIGASHTEFVKAFTSILSALLDAVIKVTPKIGKAISTILTTGISIIRRFFPAFVRLGIDLLEKLLDGISSRISHIVRKATDIVVKLLNGIRDNLPRVIRAGANLIIAFVNGIAEEYPRIIDAGFKAVIKLVRGVANAIDSNAGTLRREGANLARAIIDGMTGGLFSGIGRVAEAAKNAARSALNAAKNFLGIKSPSKAFAELGRYSMEGMAEGIIQYSDRVADASEGVADTAISSIRDSMRDISDTLSHEVDMNPTIAPVLDLSDVRAGASTLENLLNVGATGLTYTTAANVSTERRTAVQQQEAAQEAAQAATIQFIQNNNSPKALSTIDIYRQTRNQLSLAKEALAT